MATQPSRINLSIASPSEIERTARQLMAIREDFLNAGSLASSSARPFILDSWQRCRALDVNPSLRRAPLAIAREAQLAQLREGNGLLIRAAQPVLQHLRDFLAGSGHVIVLTDAHGYLLSVCGDAALCRRLERIDFVPGGNWSEAGAGTNGIGTALADGHSVQLLGAEHYCDGWQDLTCTATPIRHPLTHEVVGILNVTGNYRLIRSFLISFLATTALEITRGLQELLTPSLYRKWGLEGQALFRDTSQITNIRNIAMHLFSASQNPEPSNMPIGDIHRQLNLQQRRARDAEHLVAATGIISASLDLTTTLKNVREQVANLLVVERSGILLFAEPGEAEPELQHGLKAPLLTLLKASGVASLIRERGEPVVIDDLADSALVPVPLWQQAGIRSMLLLPLVTARGVRGFIVASRAVPQVWSIEDVRLGLAFATQSASAIENARLFDALQQHNRHIKTLNAIAQLLNTLPDPGQHLDYVLQRITELISSDVGLILLLDERGEQLTLAASCGLVDAPQSSLEGLAGETLQELARRVISAREPLAFRANDYEDAAIAEALRQAGFAALRAVPLTTSSTILGVLLVGARDAESALAEETKYFSTIGQQLALALNNAQLLRSASEMEALREADRLKSNFLAAVSHDLRSPLTAIRASVESLLDSDGVQSAQGQEGLLHTIAGQVNRLDRLVDQLLDLSKIEAGALTLDCEWVDLSVLVDDALKEFERLHTGCAMTKAFDADVPLLYIDRARLSQVVWNLLENVHKYAPLGSPVRVETRLLGNEALISIADRGPGIPYGEHEKVFQRFYRLDREKRSYTQGSGLGLAICKGIVEEHGGRIWVEDQAGGGCTFHIALRPPAFGPVGFDPSEEQKLLM